MSNKHPLLQMENIRKSFPGVLALDGVSLTLHRGEVLALMGENGAGKSTLMKCLFGIHRPDGGRILLEGEPVEFKSPADAMGHGVAMVHQELNQALKLSVADNLWLGRFPTLHSLFPWIRDGEIKSRTREVLESLDIRTDPDTPMEKLSVSERQMAEIAKAVSYDARVIVFDEPTSSLNENEAEKLFTIINMLRCGGVGVIYISHKMREILEIADRVAIMRDGKNVAAEPAKDLTTDRIISLMVGRELTNRYPKRDTPPGDPILQVEGISGKHSRLRAASLSLRAGEVLGIAGLDGSGRSELLECIFGLGRRGSGVIILDGKEVENRSPSEAIQNGFALLTEERRATGIFGALSVEENTVISSLRDYCVLGLLSSRRMRAVAEECRKDMRIKTPSLKAKISSLSGGNQQKVIFGRWLLTQPRVLLLDEPTRGVDVGAKYEIYKLINRLCEQGRGVIMVSSEMEELLGMADRVAVMSGGMLAGILQKDEMTQEAIMALATKYV